jgi:hypothetical protein
MSVPASSLLRSIENSSTQPDDAAAAALVEMASPERGDAVWDSNASWPPQQPHYHPSRPRAPPLAADSRANVGAAQAEPTARALRRRAPPPQPWPRDRHIDPRQPPPQGRPGDSAQGAALAGDLEASHPLDLAWPCRSAIRLAQTLFASPSCCLSSEAVTIEAAPEPEVSGGDSDEQNFRRRLSRLYQASKASEGAAAEAAAAARSAAEVRADGTPSAAPVVIVNSGPTMPQTRDQAAAGAGAAAAVCKLPRKPGAKTPLPPQETIGQQLERINKRIRQEPTPPRVAEAANAALAGWQQPPPARSSAHKKCGRGPSTPSGAGGDAEASPKTRGKKGCTDKGPSSLSGLPSMTASVEGKQQRRKLFEKPPKKRLKTDVAAAVPMPEAARVKAAWDAAQHAALSRSMEIVPSSDDLLRDVFGGADATFIGDPLDMLYLEPGAISSVAKPATPESRHIAVATPSRGRDSAAREAMHLDSISVLCPENACLHCDGRGHATSLRWIDSLQEPAA